MKNFRRKAFPKGEALRLREEGLSYREIGEELGYSTSAVHQQLNDETRRKKQERMRNYDAPTTKEYKRNWHREYMKERYNNDSEFRRRMLKSMSIYEKKLRKKRRESGLCTTCGGPTENFIRCAECRADTQTRLKKMRDKRRDEGICVSCGKQTPEEGRNNCKVCLEKLREYRRLKRRVNE
jgi:predicted transcriptional regulator